MKFGTVVLVGTDVRKKRHNWKVSTDYVNASVSTRILGRFAAIASLTHPNLCKYLELFKCQTGNLEKLLFFIRFIYSSSWHFNCERTLFDKI